MSGKSNFLESKILDLVFGRTAYVIPATLYVALYTSPPTDAGGGTEVAGGSYARAAVANEVAKFPNAVAGAKSNAEAVLFAPATASWGTVVAAGIFDALEDGNLLFWNNLTSAIPVPNGGTFSFAIGQINFTEN